MDISTSSLFIDYINPKNNKRLNFIIKLHSEDVSIKQIVEILKLKSIRRRNKNDDYSVKDVWVRIDKMKKRVDREKEVKYSLGDWILKLDLIAYFNRSWHWKSSNIL